MKKVALLTRGWETIREPNSPLLIFSILVLLTALPLGVTIGALSLVYSAVATGTIIMVIILLLRLDELTVTLIVAAHIIIDSYLGFDVYQIALLMALVLLIVCYFGRSANHPWIGPRSIWLWVLFLILNIYPTINGGAFSQIVGAAVSRSGSFLGNPNGNGVFLATSFFLPLGLFIESKHLWSKMIYLLETLLILSALMFTYSTGSWIAVLTGILIFMFLIGRKRYSVLLLVLITVLTVIAVTIFPTQIAAQLSHSSRESELSLHMGDWQTSVRVIEAFPLFGVGLGSQAYLVRAEPYRVPAQTVSLAEPDNSYLQWGAIAGIPVMLVFLLLLSFIFLFAWRNWLAIDNRYRSLLGGGIVALIALSINSLSVDGWTDAAGLAYLGWLIAGIVSSTLIGRCSATVAHQLIGRQR